MAPPAGSARRRAGGSVMTASMTPARAIQIVMERWTTLQGPLPRVRGRDREGARAASRARAFRSPSKASSSPNPPAPSPTSRSATASSTRNSATATSPPSTATSSPSNSTRRARSGWWIALWSGCERRRARPRRVAGFAPPPLSPAQLKHHQRRKHNAAAERLQRREHLGEKERAADGREQGLEIHEQRRAERADAHGRGEHAEEAGGDRGAQPNEGEPPGRRRGRLPVPRRQRDN